MICYQDKAPSSQTTASNISLKVKIGAIRTSIRMKKKSQFLKNSTLFKTFRNDCLEFNHLKHNLKYAVKKKGIFLRITIDFVLDVAY